MTFKDRYLRRENLTWFVTYLMATWLVAHAYLHYTGDFATQFTWFPKTEFGAMVDESGTRPYVGRMLVPTLVRGMSAITTPQVKSIEKTLLTSMEFNADFVRPNWLSLETWPTDLTNFYFLSVLLFLGIGIAGRAAYAAVFKEGGFRAGLAGLLLLLAVPMWFHGDSFFYDPMTILLSTWLLFAIVKRSPGLCCILFALACFNKETAVLFAPLIVFGFWMKYKETKVQDNLYATVAVGFILVIVAAAVQMYRLNHFAGNPGEWMENNFADVQLQLFTKYFSTTIFEGFVMIVMLIFSFTGFKYKPMILKAGTLFVFAPLALSSVAVGRVIEVRALYDAYPILGLLAMPTFFSFLKVPATPNLGLSSTSPGLDS